MKKILILAGTTEGRMLSDKMESAGIKHIVSVTSEYGETMMGEGENRTLKVGKMDENAMTCFLEKEGFEEGDYLVDATHPFAKEASLNAKNVAAKMKLSYLRVVRDSVEIPDSDSVLVYDSMENCAEALKDINEPIILTTGSKGLEEYAGWVSKETLSNTYVRVIPSIESFEKCKAAGIDESHIVALQGPFSLDLNKALLSQYKIRHLVTKESGKAGGFAEKLKAALECGATIHVISRPEETEGMGLAETERILLSEFANDNLGEIILAGVGMGDRLSMTREVEEAIKSADVIFGAGRLLEGIQAEYKFDKYLADDVMGILRQHPEFRKAVVLFSGDSGFYSGARKFNIKVNSDFKGKVTVLPGVSSVAYLASRLEVSYDDAFIYSLHGRFSKETLNEALWNIRYSEKSFILFSGASDVSALATEMNNRGITGEITLGINLSSASEEIVKLSVEAAMDFNEMGSIIGYVHNMKAEKRPLIPFFRDDDFIRDKTPMTKEVIRHESIRRLGICEGDMIYDIGGGTGSVAIEIAGLHPTVKVVTIEVKDDRAVIIRQNAAKHHMDNLQVITGDACEVLRREDMPKPDAVFIGGSGGKLKEIMDVLSGKGSGIRFVINAVTIETIMEVEELLNKLEPRNLRAIQIGVNNLENIGRYHMFRAENPVVIYSFEL